MNLKPAAAVTAAMLGLCSLAQASGDKATTLYQFDTVSGYTPSAGLIADANGILYGTTTLGGTGTCNDGAGCGTVFSLTPPAHGQSKWTFTKLYDFQGGNDGNAPTAPLTLGPSGELYGYTSTTTPGSVFRLLPPAGKSKNWQFDVVYVFRGAGDGTLVGMHAPLMMNKLEVVGLAAGGRGDCNGQGCGSVFGLKGLKDGTWAEETVHRFTGGTDSGLPNWLAAGGSKAPVVATTLLGHGAVVALTPPGLHGLQWEMKTITTFAGGTDGEAPTNIIADSAGKLFGIASLAKGGKVFQMTPPHGIFSTKWTRTTVATIDDQGTGPVALALGAPNTLVGAVEGNANHVAGDVFQLTFAGGKWSDQTLWDFSQGPDRNPLDALRGHAAALYGVLQGGGASMGSIYQLTQD